MMMRQREYDQIKLELLKVDLQLRKKQLVWETPRNIAILAAALAAIFSAIGGFIGYKIGASPSPPIVIQLRQ